MIIALETDAQEDLRPLTAWLRAGRIPHRVWEASGRLHLAVPDERFVPVVEDGVARLRAGTLDTTTPAHRPPREALGTRFVVGVLERQPVTALLVLLTLAFFPATALPLDAVGLFTLRWLMIVPIQPVGDFLDFPTLSATLQAGELWRLWTPALLHFGVVHLVFNLLWLWEFGRRIEIGGGRRRLLEAILLIAPLANVAQYLADQGPRFGGLSGVVYGLLGYLLVAGRRSAHPAFRLPAGLVLALLAFLVFFTTGATEPFGLHVANGAHWGGLVAGIALAILRVPASRVAPGDDRST